MHDSSYKLMKRILCQYLDQEKSLNVVDIGSGDVNGTYRPLFNNTKWKYTGVDIEAGNNVDLIITCDYKWNIIQDGSYDVVISGQALEHMDCPWLAAAEMYRICKPGGICVVIAPAVWVYHPHPKDCFRIYPDGMRGLFGTVGFTEIECSMRETIGHFVDTWFVGRKYQ